VEAHRVPSSCGHEAVGREDHVLELAKVAGGLGVDAGVAVVVVAPLAPGTAPSIQPGICADMVVNLLVAVGAVDSHRQIAVDPQVPHRGLVAQPLVLAAVLPVRPSLAGGCGMGAQAAAVAKESGGGGQQDLADVAKAGLVGTYHIKDGSQLVISLTCSKTFIDFQP